MPPRRPRPTTATPARWCRTTVAASPEASRHGGSCYPHRRAASVDRALSLRSPPAVRRRRYGARSAAAWIRRLGSGLSPLASGRHAPVLTVRGTAGTAAHCGGRSHQRPRGQVSQGARAVERRSAAATAPRTLACRCVPDGVAGAGNHPATFAKCCSGVAHHVATVSIVDLLEVVGVDHQQRHRLAVPLRLRHLHRRQFENGAGSALRSLVVRRSGRRSSSFLGQLAPLMSTRVPTTSAGAAHRRSTAAARLQPDPVAVAVAHAELTHS